MKYIINLPENMFNNGEIDCLKCPITSCECFDPLPEYCPLANAKEAVEYEVVYEATGKATLLSKDGGHKDLPAKLYAVQDALSAPAGPFPPINSIDPSVGA